MMAKLASMLVALVALIVATGAAAHAHEGHDHKILGTVTMAAPDHLMLEDRDGKEVTVLVTKDTKVKASPPMRVEQIEAGTRVVVTATMGKDKSWTAKLIEVGAAAGGK
jgi:methionine-rich copper-binding protein CopC